MSGRTFRFHAGAFAACARNGEVIKVGSSKIQKTNEWVAATIGEKQPSAMAVSARICLSPQTVPVYVPPLRERKDDCAAVP
jgi:transcriptional regulator with GAF, ATPase, and Fis domain